MRLLACIHQPVSAEATARQRRLKRDLFEVNIGADGIADGIGKEYWPVIMKIISYLINNEDGNEIFKKDDYSCPNRLSFGDPVGSLGWRETFLGNRRQSRVRCSKIRSCGSLNSWLVLVFSARIGGRLSFYLMFLKKYSSPRDILPNRRRFWQESSIANPRLK